MPAFSDLTKQILAFRDERNWKQFHSPRNLAAAVAIESGELQELMLWKTDTEVQEIVSSPEGKQKIAAEIADILIFVCCFAMRQASTPRKRSDTN